MKLRTTVQLTSAITSTVAQSKKTSLKREDSFIARFSTRQIPEAQVRLKPTPFTNLSFIRLLQRLSADGTVHSVTKTKSESD